MTSEFTFGILAVAMLPEEYKEAGIYDGNFHGAGRSILNFFCIVLSLQIWQLGRTIKKMLEKANKKRQVSPNTAENENEEDENEDKETENNGQRKTNVNLNPLARKKNMVDSEKMAFMVKMTSGTMVIVVAYLFLDISRSFGKFRHITPPSCSTKDLFVRLPSFVQAFSGALYYFLTF